MEEKGLCATCAHDKDCAFRRKFPIWRCEEFTDFVTKPQETTVSKTKKK